MDFHRGDQRGRLWASRSDRTPGPTRSTAPRTDARTGRLPGAVRNTPSPNHPALPSLNASAGQSCSRSGTTAASRHIPQPVPPNDVRKPSHGEPRRLHAYVLGSSDEEVRRLIAQSAQLRPAAEVALDRIPIQPGWRAVDVGCGPLGILDLLESRVGPSGIVIGLDRDRRTIQVASRRQADRRGGPHLICKVVDVRADSALPVTGADLAHVRLLLAHVPDPERVVRRALATLRPGGWVLVQEYDWSTWSCDPHLPAFEELRDRIADLWTGDVRIGRRLGALLESTGVVSVSTNTIRHPAAHPKDDRYTLLLHFTGVIRARLLAHAPAGVEPFDRLVDAVRRHLGQPGRRITDPDLHQAWGQWQAR
ncbi:methyltransferase domain-containing protein [Streptomyces sp. NPDC127068]|uniref:methyltransferase domain-containing protein n=1 Tax=Streptomyces sp. NPDC127068 TaxID=3347127 RepID=UPI003661C9C3